MSYVSRNIPEVCKRLLLVSIAAICCSVTALSQAPAPAATDKNASGTDANSEKDLKYVIEVGGQFRDVNGDRPSKFEEFKGVRNGFLFRRGSFEYNPSGSPTYFNFAGRNVSERDQQYFAEAGRYGQFRLEAEWNSQPHLYARGVKSLLGSSGPGVYSVPDSIQADLQTLDPPMAGTTVANPALTTAVKSYVSSSSPFDLRSQRQTFTFDGRYNITSHWTVRFGYFETKRFGQRPLGTGTYERTGTGTGDMFRVHSIELPAQIDQRTSNFSIGTSYTASNWGVNFDYTYSQFRNEIDSYVYDNPFRLVDQATTGTGGAFNRMAFARGIHGTMPDNESHGIMISGFVNLPMSSRWAGAFGWERWTQNEQFLPYTLNSQTGAPFDVTNADNLPQESLEGVIENLTVDQLFTTRPFDNLTINVRYKVYREENKTEPILFPGYAAFLESWWRTAITGSFGTRLIENEPASYTRQRAGGEVIWEPISWLKWRGEYEFERWDRTHRQVETSDEHKLMTTFTFKPTSKLRADIDYRYQDRTPDFYFSGPLENQRLRMFDQAKRIRNDARFRWQWAATPRLGLSGDFAYFSDDYDQNQFGLARYIERRAGIEALFNPRENATVYINYSREHYNSTLNSISKTGAPFNDLNRWNREDRAINDNFGIGASTYLYKAKWFLDVNYNYNLGRDLMTSYNVSTPQASAVLNATTYDFPESEYRYQEFSVDTNYQVYRNISLGFRYYYEPFKLDDWQLNGLSPYPVDQLAPETDGRKFLLLDSRYTSHNAHIVSLYIRFGN